MEGIYLIYRRDFEVNIDKLKLSLGNYIRECTYNWDSISEYSYIFSFEQLEGEMLVLTIPLSDILEAELYIKSYDRDTFNLFFKCYEDKKLLFEADVEDTINKYTDILRVFKIKVYDDIYLIRVHSDKYKLVSTEKIYKENYIDRIVLKNDLNKVDELLEFCYITILYYSDKHNCRDVFF